MSKIYPDEAKCIKLLKDAGCNKRIIIHCCTVRTVAEQMMMNIKCNRELVVAGSLLHDIGRAKNHSIFHAVIGAEMAEKLGLSDEIVSIIRKHIGAGLDNKEAAQFGLPAGDYIPKTIEEKIVAHADNMVSDNSVVEHIYAVDKLKYKGSSSGAKRIEKLHKELSELYGEDLDNIISVIGKYPDIVGPCGKFLK